MIYFGIYVLIGMVIAGIQFPKTFKYGFSDEEKTKIKNNKLDDDIAVKAVTVFVTAVIISMFIVFLYPIFITALLAKKVMK